MDRLPVTSIEMKNNSRIMLQCNCIVKIVLVIMKMFYFLDISNCAAPAQITIQVNADIK